jgi:bacteriocin biosynthesis cyclodehydratase domain-containing protein
MAVNKSSKPLHVLSVGAFGQAVSRYLKDIVETVVTERQLPMPEVWPASRMLLLASWRPVPTLCELLGDLSFEWVLPFIPLILDSTSMRLGPVILPGAGSCWRCWLQRNKQHAQWPKEQLALLEHYATHAEAGPRGYLEAFAMMAAARLKWTISQLNSGSPMGGYIWKIDMVTREITASTVIGVHGCPQCGVQRPTITRSVDDMIRQLGYLWEEKIASSTMRCIP